MNEGRTQNKCIVIWDLLHMLVLAFFFFFFFYWKPLISRACLSWRLCLVAYRLSDAFLKWPLHCWLLHTRVVCESLLSAIPQWASIFWIPLFPSYHLIMTKSMHLYNLQNDHVLLVAWFSSLLLGHNYCAISLLLGIKIAFSFLPQCTINIFKCVAFWLCYTWR